MRVLLVRPWVNKKITTVKNFLFGEPLGIECVSTVLKEHGHEVLLVDFMIETRGELFPYLQSFRPQAVGVTSQCTDVENVLLIARQVKAWDAGVPVLVGGVQAACFPDSFFTGQVDYVFRSTTRDNIGKLMAEIESGDPPRLIEGVYSRSLDFQNDGEFCLNEYIVPDRACTQRYRSRYQYIGFQPCAVVQTAYGCRNRCRFCVRWKLEGPILREVEIGEIVDQVEALEEPYVMICDNDFLINEERLTRFMDLLESRNIRKKYMCYGSVNSILEKPDLFERLAKNGLMAVIIGYEDFDDSKLSGYHKTATVDQNLEATQILHKHGIACWGSFIIHPDWGKEDFRRLLRHIARIKPELVTFSPLVPHPLTPLYDEFKHRLIYPVEQYEKWNFGDVIVHPSKMSLRAYYIQVLLLAFRVNLNTHAIGFVWQNIPLRNSSRMLFGFRSLISVYLKNIFLRKNLS
ncbi:MAG: radical SAM protein [Peptococcaceae bacterium]|jgi:radical SAM superfamily enzyme YgiQ (UPF0313 family)|nr:radical SAM protein [Peptococcaceae bacterium]